MLVSAPRLLLLAVPLALSTPSFRALAADAGAGASTAAAVAASPRAAQKAPASKIIKTTKATKAKGPKNPPVVLFSVNHKETFPLRLRDGQGKPIKGNQKRFDRFLRCHHTEAKHAMNPRLMRLLYQTGRHWPGRKLEIVSGYRAPSVAKNPHSPHMKGLACDFYVDGIKTADLRDYLRKNFQKVGVGYYPNSTFVHLDVRKDKSAFWIDYSGPGERAVYSESPNEDLKNGRADSYHPTKIDESWATSDSEPWKGSEPLATGASRQSPAGPTREAPTLEGAGAKPAPAPVEAQPSQPTKE